MFRLFTLLALLICVHLSPSAVKAQTSGTNAVGATSVTMIISFTPNPRDEAIGLVKTYSLWMQATNEPDKNKHYWLASLAVKMPPVPGTDYAISQPATNLPAACYLFVTADSLSQTGDWSDPLFYDYPVVLQKLKPAKVTSLGVTPILK